MIFEEPIQHRISRTDYLVNYNELLVNLQLAGAETVIYFTDEDILNVELSISIGDNSYSHITYKASIQNLDQNFEFKESKLNEFRKILVETNELDFDILDKSIKDRFKNQIDIDIIFFNKIDEDRYETIRIENNNCYYKLIYNPKL